MLRAHRAMEYREGGLYYTGLLTMDEIETGYEKEGVLE